MDFKCLENEFVVTIHARDMLLLRFGCGVGKVKKVAIKAWLSRVPINGIIEYRKRRKYKGGIYRLYAGCIFVFVLDHEGGGVVKKKLITVYHPKKDVIKRD